ncbi:MAG: primosomal protein N' [Kiritimatiellia bacterium]
MTVAVAIDLALDRLFTYAVPEALEEKLAVGQLLSVPFGHREARGFALAVDGGAAGADDGAGHRLKPVTAIVDETPFFSPALLELAKKVAAYTASPVETVLRAALPAAVLKRNARPKAQLFVEAVTEARAGGAGLALTARQEWLYDNVLRLGGGWLTPLCRELRTTPASLRQLARLGLVTILPRERRRDPIGARRLLPSRPLPLNPEQQAALDALTSTLRPSLLFGVTGSGKTEVYLQAIAKELDAGRGAIVMVPEIALTPQTVSRFASRFGDRVAVLHSALSDGERYDEWHRIRSGAARVVVGPRSAVWAPVRRLGLIVVDEEHETSYKQDETPRYNARDVAVLRGAVEGARVVLGSATPSLESWMNVKRGKYALATMRRRAGAGRLPAVRTVEMSGGEIFSRELLEAIGLRLDRHEQTILFLNRRGYSRAVTCSRCGHTVACPACGIPYAYHRADACLRCHVCGGWTPLPAACPACNCPGFDFAGIGTQRAEAALAKCFRHARILRMDADSTSRKQSHDDILSAFRRGEADVLLGTQMIAKGLDFPNVTLVGVLNADSSLNLPDFRAGERTYQLLAQVAGRAGRAELPGEVILQSHDVSAPVLQAVVRGDYEGFSAAELKARAECFLPPYCHFAVALFSSADLRLVGAWATMYAKSLAAYAARSGGLRVSEAMPCALEKADGRYRWQVVLRAERAAEIVRAWRWIVAARPPPGTLRVGVDIDAFSVI